MSAETGPLQARYRRLLLAYPRRYRRTRGLEMLTMLLDSAEPGRTRPTRAEAIDLLVGGLRCRLRPPGRRGVRAVAVLLAFVGAILGASGGTWLGWSSATPLPAGTRGVVIVPTAINDPRTGEPYPEVERSFDNSPRATLGPDDRTIDWAGAAIHSRDPDATLAKAGRNLTTAGWQVHPTSSGGITATKADVTVRVWTDGHTVLFAFTRHEPSAVPLLAAGGALLGGLLAWLLTCWAARRVLTAPQPVQSTTAALAVIGLTMLLPVLAALGPTIIAEYLPIDPIPLPVATIIGTPFPTITAITAAGLLAEVLALLLAALSSGRPGARQLGGTPADG